MYWLAANVVPNGDFPGSNVIVFVNSPVLTPVSVSAIVELYLAVSVSAGAVCFAVPINSMYSLSATSTSLLKSGSVAVTVNVSPNLPVLREDVIVASCPLISRHFATPFTAVLVVVELSTLRAIVILVLEAPSAHSKQTCPPTISCILSRDSCSRVGEE